MKTEQIQNLALFWDCCKGPKSVISGNLSKNGHVWATQWPTSSELKIKGHGPKNPPPAGPWDVIWIPSLSPKSKDPKMRLGLVFRPYLRGPCIIDHKYESEHYSSNIIFILYTVFTAQVKVGIFSQEY